jgi:hypothetical protein
MVAAGKGKAVVAVVAAAAVAESRIRTVEPYKISLKGITNQSSLELLWFFV